MTIAIVGGGICGLSLALHLHARGIACRVYEAAPELRELGVGITLLPACDARAVRRSALATELACRRHRATPESCFFNRFGQLHLQGAARAGVLDTNIRKSAFTAAGCISGAIDAVQSSASARTASSRTITAPASTQDEQRRARCSFRRVDQRQVAAAICARHRDRLRWRELGASASSLIPATAWCSPASTPGAASRVHKPILTGRSYRPHRLDPDRQDRDLSDHRRRRWRREISSSTGPPRSSCDTPDMNDWNRPGDLADFLPDLRKLALRLARCSPELIRQVGDDLRVSDGRQGSACRAGPSGA